MLTQRMSFTRWGNLVGPTLRDLTYKLRNLVDKCDLINFSRRGVFFGKENQTKTIVNIHDLWHQSLISFSDFPGWKFSWNLLSTQEIHCIAWISDCQMSSAKRRLINCDWNLINNARANILWGQRRWHEKCCLSFHFKH